MKLKGLFTLLSLGFVVFLSSCTKLNDPTELGEDLLPVVDNINTFDTTLNVNASYHLFLDSSKTLLGENMALGKIVDPEFGTSAADMYFNLSSPVYTASPFYSKDSVVAIDSVVLSLAYNGAYGDTSAGSQLTVAVSEINTGNGFTDSTAYRFDHPGFTTGPVLGTKSFSIRNLKDSITLIRNTDTTKVGNVLRIRIDNSLGTKLSQFDTTKGSGAYANDSLFRTVFRGLAVKTTDASTPGTLAYFNPAASNSGLTVYYRVKKNGKIDTTAATFVHAAFGQANSIIRTPGGSFQANLDKPSPQLLYIQSAPTGSYASIVVPALSGFPNKVIHRAELIAYKVPSALDNIFTVPNRLLLDHVGPADTAASLFDKDIQPGIDGSINLSTFGGTLRSDNSYRFTITRYVQDVVTLHKNNDTLRMYAPLRSSLYSTSLGQKISIPILSNIAYGRVVLAGPDYPDPNLRLQLRIIYSNLN